MTAYIQKMDPAPANAEAVAKKLRGEYSMEVPSQILSDAFVLSER